uniref:NAD(P)H oxidase (H2O2-forming) n=1 Tax=Arion vulgaris TaxID=1028688 RepID=A0A0B7AIC9_9EUPU
MSRTVYRLVFLIITVLIPCVLLNEEKERHPNDGWYNNLLHPDWGAIDTHLLRRSSNSYSDGVYQPAGPERPNPFTVSTTAFNGTDGLGSVRNRNALLVFFGQQLVEEIMDAQSPSCPVEFLNIPVPKGHKYNPQGIDGLEMPFRRARFDQRTGYSSNNPRKQLNEITPYLDGSVIYGAGKSLEDALREFKDGRLLTTSKEIKSSWPVYNNIRLPFANPPSPRDHFLRPVTRFRRFGNPRTYENPFLNALAVVWFRYHNYVAQEIQRQDSLNLLNDEQIFNAARKRVIAQYQKIVMYEWLPAWLSVNDQQQTFDISEFPYEGGKNNTYAGYDPNVHPAISAEFQAAAFRYGHTLVPSGVLTKKIAQNSCINSVRAVQAKFTTAKDKGDSNVTVEGIRLCNSYWVSQETLEGEPGIDEILRGMVFTRSGKEDNIIVSDIRELVFGPLEWSRRDIGAINIQRGRELGLKSYNDVRAAYGLPRQKTWNDINSLYPDILAKLQVMYGSTDAPDDLDLFPGGLLETVPDGPGELFKAITLDQFLRIRHGDRFWFENKANGLFTEKELEEIKDTTFFDILRNVTNALDEKINISRTQVFLCVSSTDPTNCQCSNPVFDENPIREDCVPLKRYDYFKGSEVSLLVTVVVVLLSLPATIGLMMCMARSRKNSLAASAEGPLPKRETGPNHFYATEWVGRSAHGLLNSREVKINLDDARMKILVTRVKGQVVRMIDLRRRVQPEEQRSRASTTRSNDKGYKLMILAVPGEIDLALHFPTQNDRDSAFSQLQAFFNKHNWEFHEGPPMAENIIWREAMTVDQRKHVLARFFKSVLAELSNDANNADSDQDRYTEEVLATKLTRTEFADALGLQPQSLFVRNMFLLVDSSGDGFVSFDEFKTYFGILYSGKPEQKAEMFFTMFDTSRTGKLTRENYKKMIMSLIELNEAGNSKTVKVDDLVDAVLKQAGKEELGYLTMEDFKNIIFSNADEIWKSAVLNLEVAGETQPLGKRKTVRDRAHNFVSQYKRATSMVISNRTSVRLGSKIESVPKTKFDKFVQTWTRYVNNRRRQIFWLALYTLVTLGIFVERAYYYSFEREHAGLRRMAGYGVSITRGAASAQMFTYSSLLVTMSRNTLTLFRETFLHQFIPFDNAHDMHIYVAAMAMLFTIMHVVGHLINFYHISTQSSMDLNCYFREFFRPTHVLANFHYWTFQTITGITGVLLVLVLVVLYVFASPYARQNVFKYFKTTHRLYIVVYILMFLHGAARLVQPPLWSYFFLGPMVLFVLDKLVSVSRNKVLLPVHKATMLPSGVTSLVFKRPLTFNYQSGQWVRIACPKLGKGEYHPFTLTSAPHEEHLSLHIRAVGPWTSNLRKLFDYTGKSSYPKIYLDGPFGESHQDWFRYPVSVLVGGGIGVTPFASILKDIANRTNDISRLPCQKVYFVWVTRTQQSFEWMTEIIRQVEVADSANYVDVQICITQMKEQFDLRTTLLYICERHFQKIAGVSMFTGLRATTHFGRPKFPGFFRSLKTVHQDVGQIGVFSCGPPAMTSNVQQACTEQNAFTGPSLIHHFENF